MDEVGEAGISLIERSVVNTVNRLVQLFRQRPDRWANERQAHYDFFTLLLQELTADEIIERFRWEYPVGVPSYGRGRRPAMIDIIVTTDHDKWVAVEIELVSAGRTFEGELSRCIRKLQSSPVCQNSMVRGYIVPLLARYGRRRARAYRKSYSELLREHIDHARRIIRNSRIVIIKEGILPL